MRWLNTSSSSTFAYKSPTESTKDTYLDGTVLEANFATDKVCISSDANSCITSFKFGGIQKGARLASNIDGILGLWSANYSDLTYDRKKMLVPELVANTAITKSAFSWYMISETGKSYIDFGEPNTAAMFDSSKVVSLPINQNSYYWSTSITGFKWNGSQISDSTEYKLTAFYAIHDSGASCIMGPNA